MLVMEVVIGEEYMAMRVLCEMIFLASNTTRPLPKVNGRVQAPEPTIPPRKSLLVPAQ
jgi:hypothetical protein